MKKFYITLFAAFLSIGLFAQDVSIGTDLEPTLSQRRYRSPWTTSFNYSYVQTIYLKSEINKSGNITTLKYSFRGTVLDNSRTLEIYMGTVVKSEFDGSLTDWTPVSGMTKVFDGVISPSGLPGPVTINLQTAYNYTNNGNLVIAVFEKGAGNDFDANDNYTFKSTELTSQRVMYYVTDGPEGDDNPIPDPKNPAKADGTNGNIANITLTFGSTAPVMFDNFTVVKQKNGNYLKWNTRQEQNNKGFNIQRSADGIDFNTIGFVASIANNGSSNENLSYAFENNTPLRGNNYYRIEQIDLNGKSSFSKIALVKGDLKTGFTITTIYPNPVKDELNVVIASEKMENAVIEITDISGKKVFKMTRAIQIGDSKVEINTSTLAPGVYHVRATLGNSKESAVSRFVKR